MGIDLDKMRQKHSALTKAGDNSADIFWKPEEGAQVIRLVCPTDGDPFREFYFHYGLGAEGRTTVLSPRTFGETDPISEFGTKLWKNGTDEDKNAAKRFWPKMRIFAPVVVRGEEDKGVRWWGFSKTTYENLLNVVLDPDYGDITDTSSGTDIRIDYGKKSGQAFPSTDIRPMRKSSALAATDEAIEKLISTVPDTATAFERVSLEECERILQETLGGEATHDKEATRYDNTTTTTTTTTATTDNGLEGVSDIESAFDDLLA